MKKVLALWMALMLLLTFAGCSGGTGVTNEGEASVQEEEPEIEMTMGQKNALGSAESYLRFTAFSYTGLIEQLEFEGYSTEDATFAVDHCGADWKEQAQRSAES